MFLFIRIKLQSGSELAIPKTVSRPIPDDVPVMRTVRVILNELSINRLLYCTNTRTIGCSLYRLDYKEN